MIMKNRMQQMGELLDSRFLRYVPFDANGPEEDRGKNVELDWASGDKTLVQVDMSSLQNDSTAFETMTMYKYLVLLEKHKRVTSYEVSYSTCQRQTGQTTDGFDIGPKDKHCFKTIPDLTKALTCKTLFWDSAVKIRESQGLLVVFRFRFDRIHAVTKVQKPYVFTKTALSFEVGQFVAVA